MTLIQRYLAGLVLTGLLLAGVFFYGAHWQSGRDVRKAALVAAQQAQRDAASAAAYQKAVSERETAEQAAAAANRRIYADLEPRLAAAADDSRRLARLLHGALAAEPSGGPLPAPADQPGASVTPGIPSSEGAVADPVERATAEALTACQRDSDRLEALQAEVRGQMP